MRGLSALFASGLLVAASAVAPVASADGSSIAMQIASIETAPRSEMSTRYGDLSDLLAPETDRSLDPVLASEAADKTFHEPGKAVRHAAGIFEEQGQLLGVQFQR